MNNSNALAEIQSKYPNCNLLLPAATSVQINPFYKCSVMEVVADTAPNSGDIFSVGKVKTGEDRDGKAVYEEVYSPAKPLLMKLATAAGIQFHPEYTTVTRENTNTKESISLSAHSTYNPVNCSSTVSRRQDTEYGNGFTIMGYDYRTGSHSFFLFADFRNQGFCLYGRNSDGVPAVGMCNLRSMGIEA